MNDSRKRKENNFFQRQKVKGENESWIKKE